MSKGSQSLQSLEIQIESRVRAIRIDRDWWPCQRGCDACCRHLAQPLELSPAEWERVDAAVARLPDAAQAIVEQRIDALLQQIAEQTLSSAVVCPYLDEQEGACRIYDSRPIACRTYGFFVTRDHNQYCEQIETLVHNRSDGAIVWGNAEAIRNDIERISGAPVSFELHYRNPPHVNQIPSDNGAS
ncbi:YkgJ family cysteine cluster protein (plasmid) [Kovacikia minuta CCNUW1]|uniref:YkgJ family cysteine cluster protein n=1 Tax=Kovacikia minuta TaxID=2931930 RepID=UPI001CCC17FA|nr:YkgJ family cysteine cluster protein [Kovacikia minuta]UBF29951.1 YkgJ family cysteine cluster protein [Kovacikia minuta CCNUW1]